MCFEDRFDIDLNDFCGKYKEVVNYDNSDNLTNMVVTFNPIAMGAEDSLSFELNIPVGTQYLVRDEAGNSIAGVTSSNDPFVVYSSKSDAFPNSAGENPLINTSTGTSSSNYMKGKVKTIFLWFDPVIPKVNNELVNFSKLAQIRNKSFIPNQVYNYESITNGVRNMALLPANRPIPPEKVYFYDALINGVTGSDTLYNSSVGMIAPADCDPRNPIVSNDVGCREVIAQFLSSNDNVYNPSKNVDLSDSSIPDSVVPEYSPVNGSGNRLNLNDHLDQIIDLTFVHIQNQNHCDLYECPQNNPGDPTEGDGPQMNLVSPDYKNSNASEVTIEIINLPPGDTVQVFSDLNCSNELSSGVVSGNSINFNFNISTNGTYSYYYRITDLDSNVGPCEPGITYTKTNFSFSGTLTYDYIPNAGYLDYNNIRQEEIRNAKIDLFRSSDDSLVSSDVTDDNGKYSFSAPSAGDYYWILYSESVGPVVKVVDNTNAQALYAISSDAQSVGGNFIFDHNVPSGWGGSSYTGDRKSAPFAILDSIYTTTKLVKSYVPDIVFPDLTVNWSINNRPSSSANYATGQILTSHYNRSYNDGELFILGKDGTDTDEYDRHVIVHEWVHFFEDKLSRSDSMGGSHRRGDIKDMSLAFGEGFATAISGIVFGETDNSSNSANAIIYGDSFWGVHPNTGQIVPTYSQIPMESGGDTSPGWFSEISVIQIIFDLADEMAETHDSITKTLGDIINVMTGNQKTTEARTSIFSFINNFKINHPSDSTDIDTLLDNKNIEPITDDFGSTENNFNGWSGMNSVYEELSIGGSSVSGVMLGGNNYLYNDMKNNRYIYFTASSTQTRLTSSATNPGHAYYLGLFDQGELILGGYYPSSSGYISAVYNTTVGKKYVIRVFSSTNLSSAGGEIDLSISGVNE